MAEGAIIARVLASPLEVDASAWNALLARQSHATPFMRHEYLAALHESGSANARTGWTPRFMTLWQGDVLVAACPLYLKSHSYGEYVFDWAWASAYEQHGVPYYPKAVVAVPFTPVPGTRLLARDEATRQLLVQALRQWCEDEGLSSLHVLFASDDDVLTSARQGLMPRHTVQFHWKNVAYPDFDTFLASLTQEKRKKIRQERRRVAEAGVSFRWARGADITASDWDFFYRCYERTYLEHGNPPYLTRAFFQQMADRMPEHWLLFIAEREGRSIASSLIAVDAAPSGASGTNRSKNPPRTAYGRYWGALERVDCLHFEACYYQPLAWCIAQGVQHFEGGAQGEHKMARALLPVQATSMHWLAHPAFADAVERFLAREGAGVEDYLDHLQARSPFRTA
ncbi:MAG TPA: GNAT family N-acetyltransferase [Acidovorax sp.]